MASRFLPLLIMVALTAAVPVAAQSIERPYRGLFGPAERDEVRPPQFVVGLSVYSGLDDSSRFATGGVADDALTTGRAHLGATLSLGYVRRRPRSTIAMTGSSAARYYSSLHNVTTQRHGGGIGVEFLTSERMQIRAAQSISYSPSYQLTLSQPPQQEGSELSFGAAGVDYSVSRDKQITYGSFGGATYTFSSSREFTLGYNFGYTDFFHRADFSNQQASARFTQRLTSDMSLKLGYGFGVGTLGNQATVKHHDIDVGVNYNRSFAVSRRTTIGFTSGSTVISTGGAQHFELIGGVQARRLLAPRWTSTASYMRGLMAIDSVPRPFVTSTVSGEVRGYASSRVSLSIQPSYAWGADVANANRTFHSAVSQTRADVAVNRNWALYAEHFYYFYRFAGMTDLPQALPTGFSRQGLRFGLALWAPVIH